MIDSDRGAPTGTGNKNRKVENSQLGMSGPADLAVTMVSEGVDAAAGERGNQAANYAGDAKGLASQASEKLMQTAEQQKAAGADFVSGMAGAVRRAANEFEGEVPQAAQYIRYAADQMESVSDAFRRRDIGQMIGEVQSFARRQPTAFIGVTFLAGFAAVRFLKSSSTGAARSGEYSRNARTEESERFSQWSSPAER